MFCFLFSSICCLCGILCIAQQNENYYNIHTTPMIAVRLANMYNNNLSMQFKSSIRNFRSIWWKLIYMCSVFCGWLKKLACMRSEWCHIKHLTQYEHFHFGIIIFYIRKNIVFQTNNRMRCNTNIIIDYIFIYLFWEKIAPRKFYVGSVSRERDLKKWNRESAWE